MIIITWGSRPLSVFGESNPRADFWGGRMSQLSCCVIMMMVILTLPAMVFGQRCVEDKVPLSKDAWKLQIQGNAAINDRQLSKVAKEELAEAVNNTLRCAAVDDAAFLMEQFYREKGYTFAVVHYEVKRQPDQRLHLIFTVNEGPRVLLDKVSISGNHFFTEEELQAFFHNKQSGLPGFRDQPFVEHEIQSGVGSLRDLYYGRGFLEAKVEGPDLQFSEDRSRVNVGVRVHEGPRSLIDRVEFAGDIVAGLTDTIGAIGVAFEKSSYSPWKKVELRSRVLEEYGRLGFPDAVAEVEAEFADLTGEVTLRVGIDAGSPVRIAAIEVVGNQRTTAEFIRSRVQFQPGDRYNVLLKRESFRNLFATGLFASINLSLVPGEEDDLRILVIKVTELPSREASWEVGWGSYEMLRGRLGIRENNFLGTGKVVRAEVGASFKGEDLLLGYSDPWFFSSQFKFDLPVYLRHRQEPVFDRRENGFSPRLTRPLGKNLTGIVGYNYRRTVLEALDTGLAAEKYYNASIEMQLAWDSRNDLFYPTRGRRAFFATEYAGKALGSQVEYVRLTGGVRNYIALRSTTVLALRYDTGFIMPTGTEVTLPVGERFFNGGENTVRSFRQDRLGLGGSNGDPLGGAAFNVFSFEIRQSLTRNVAISLFADWGNLSPGRSMDEEAGGGFDSRADLIDATLGDYFSGFRPALGCGVQYLLPIGPLRLDVAVNPDRDRDAGERDVTIHFSVGMAF